LNDILKLDVCKPCLNHFYGLTRTVHLGLTILAQGNNRLPLMGSELIADRHLTNTSQTHRPLLHATPCQEFYDSRFKQICSLLNDK